MSGVNWKYNNDSKSRIFWSVSSDCYIYLEQLFIDFKIKFNQQLEKQTAEFQLSDLQIEFLIKELEIKIDKLLLNFNPNVPEGLTSVPNEFKGIKYNFFIKMSGSHRLLNRLIKFHRFLSNSLSDKKEVLFWGGKIE